jgi:hypothetical protein
MVPVVRNAENLTFRGEADIKRLAIRVMDNTVDDDWWNFTITKWCIWFYVVYTYYQSSTIRDLECTISSVQLL